MASSTVILTTSSALGCGIVGGVFFAFSTFVMPALAELPARQSVAAMKSINVEAVNPWLMTALFGTACACAATAIAMRGPGRTLAIAGAVVYLVGALAVTLVCNVPRNEALASLAPDAADSVRAWSQYLRSWTLWNHLRAAASCVAMVLMIASLRLSSMVEQSCAR